MIAQQPHEAPVGELRRVNFGGPEGQRLVPKGREQSAFAAVAQAIGACPAHARAGGGLADAAGAGERVEKLPLALGGPAVPSTPLGASSAVSRAGPARTKRIGWAHPSVWITSGGV